MLSASGQRILKALHVTCAGLWLGTLSAIVLLQLWGPADPTSPRTFGSDSAAYALHETLLPGAFVGTLVTALLYSTFTKWGFAKHDWVACKWVLALALFAATLWLQSPAISGVVALADAGVAEVAGHRYADYREASLRWALLQLSIVVTVFFISTIKPWGRRERDLPVSRRTLLAVIGVLAAGGTAFAVAGHMTLRHYRTLPIADLKPAADGQYRGEANCGFRYAVDVRVEQGRFVSIDVVANRDAHYARLGEAVLPRILARQSPRVDAITGATTTSRCLMKAVENALRGAPR